MAQVQNLCQNGQPVVPVVEATISQLQQAMMAGQAKCSDIVAAYAQVRHVLSRPLVVLSSAICIE